MKQIGYLILLIGFFSFSGKTAAQEAYRDVATQNSDSIIKGIIVETEAPDNIGIKVSDGKPCIFPKEEVESTKKESIELAPAPQSLQSKPQYTFQKERNPGLAFLFSFLLPGGGQYYNRQYAKGGIMTGLAVASYTMMISTILDNVHYDFSKGIRNMTIFSFGAILYIGNALWSMIDAPIVSYRISKLANIRLSKNTNLHIRPDYAFSNELPGGRTTLVPSIGMKFSLTLK